MPNLDVATLLVVRAEVLELYDETLRSVRLDREFLSPRSADQYERAGSYLSKVLATIDRLIAEAEATTTQEPTT